MLRRPSGQALLLTSALLAPAPGCQKEVRAAPIAELPILSRVPVIAERMVTDTGKGLLHLRVNDPLAILELGVRCEAVIGTTAYFTHHQRDGDGLLVQLEGEYTEPERVMLVFGPYQTPTVLAEVPAALQSDGSYDAHLDLAQVDVAVVDFIVHAPERMADRLTVSARHHSPTGERLELHGSPSGRWRALVPVPRIVELELRTGKYAHSADTSRTHLSRHEIATAGKVECFITPPAGSLTLLWPEGAASDWRKQRRVWLHREDAVAMRFEGGPEACFDAEGRAQFDFLAPGRYLVREGFWSESSTIRARVVAIGSEPAVVQLDAPPEQGSLHVKFEAGAPTLVTATRAGFAFADRYAERATAETGEVRFAALDRDRWYVRAQREERYAYAVVDTRDDAHAEVVLDNWTYPALLSLSLNWTLPPGEVAVQITDASGSLCHAWAWRPQNGTTNIDAVPGLLTIQARHESGLVAAAELDVPERVGGRQPYELTLEFRQP